MDRQSPRARSGTKTSSSRGRGRLRTRERPGGRPQEGKFMDLEIAGKVCLGVGGSKGIGFEVAGMLASEGSQLAVVARAQKHIDRAVGSIVAEGGIVMGIAADMTEPEDIERDVA